MNSERFWISLLVLVVFAAGLAAGVLLAPTSVSARIEPAFAPYLERLVTQFELNVDQERDLRIALAEYEEQIERLRDRSLANQQDDLITAGENCFLKIRDYIIPIDRRAEFDRLIGGPEAADLPATAQIQ